MKKSNKPPAVQPQPRIPGLTRRMVKAHAVRLYRDILPRRSLTSQEWRLAEQDLARKLERDGF